jgi:sulfate permease, SulP family
VSPQEANQILAQQNAVLLDVRRTPNREERTLPAGVVAHTVVRVPALAPLPVAVDADGHAERVSYSNPSFVDDVLFAVSPEAALIIMDDDDAVASRAAHELASACRNKLHVLRGGLRAWLAASTTAASTEMAIATSTTPPQAALPVRAPSGGVFRPKMLDVLAAGYTASDIQRDALAGATVGVIALALSMALGIASESTPHAGLLTAISAGFVVSAFGGSRVNVTGPTAAFIPVIVGVSHEYGAQGLITCTALSGLMLVAMGSLGLGKLIQRVPHPVISGFTAGIAVFILSTQLKDALGLHLPPGEGAVPPGFLDKLDFVFHHLDFMHGPSLALAAACLVLLRTYPAAWASVLPPQIFTVVAATAAVSGLQAAGIATGIDTIASRFGDIPAGVPAPHFALPSADTVVALLKPSFTIALLGAIESLLCCVVADGMIADDVDDRSNSNTELIALGLGNLAAASLGGLPATGALARTAANVRSRGRSPVAGMVHAVVVLSIMSFASPLASRVPLPALAAVLVMVAINMGEWRTFKQLPGLPAGEASVYLLSFALTVLTDVTLAVEAGLALSVILYLKRVDDASTVTALLDGKTSAVGVETVRLEGMLLFGSTDKLHAAVDTVLHAPRCAVLHLDCSALLSVDATGLDALQDAHGRLTKAHKGLVVSGLHGQPHAAIAATGLLTHIGYDNVTHDFQAAAKRAGELAASQSQ